MTKYVPTTEQRLAFGTDHDTQETKRSIVSLIATGKGIDRALIRTYISHDVDTTGVCDTVGVFFVDIVVKGEKLQGYGTFAFNLVNRVPIAADFRDFRATVEA